MDDSPHPTLPHQVTRSDARRLTVALTAILLFMGVEIVVALLSSSLALLSDAAHMLTDAAALAMALLASRLAARPARGAMTFGLGRAEILSANANGMTLLVLALMIVYGAIRHLVTPVDVQGVPVLAVALAGILVSLGIVRVLGAHGHGLGEHAHAHTHRRGTRTARSQTGANHDDTGTNHDDTGAHHDHAEPGRTQPSPTRRRQTHPRSLNLEGSYQHILTDLFGFLATAVAAAVILLTGFRRADAIASLLIAAVMLRSSYGLLRASVRVMMEAAPVGVDPAEIGGALAGEPGVAEVHDLHVWEVTSGFTAVSAHVIVAAGYDCHQVRRSLAGLLRERFQLAHSTLQLEHARASQAPMQIEVARLDAEAPARQGGGAASPDGREAGAPTAAELP